MSTLTLKRKKSTEPSRKSWQPKSVPVKGKFAGVKVREQESNGCVMSTLSAISPSEEMIISEGTCRVEKAVTLAQIQREKDLLVYVHAGDKKRRDGFSREYVGRGKQHKPSTARTLDFSANPVTGTRKYQVNERLLNTRNHYVESNLIKKQSISELVQELALLKANKPPRFIVQEIKDEQGNITYKEVGNLKAVTDWENKIRGLMGTINDCPVPIVRGKAGEQTEIDADGNVSSVGLAKSMNPYEKPANAKIARPAFGGKIEPETSVSLEGMGKVIANPKLVEAFSESRELPFPVALYLVCVQEGIDYQEQYGITDLMIKVIADEYKAKSNRMTQSRAKKIFEEYKAK